MWRTISAVLSDRRFVLSVPADDQARRRIREAARSGLPTGFALDVVAAGEAEFPDREADLDGAAARGAYLFRATREAGGRVDVEGVIGDEAAKAVIAAYARAQLGGDQMQARLALAETPPPNGWQRAIFAGLEALGGLDQGELALTPKAVHLRGSLTRGDRAAAAIRPLETKTPQEFARFSNIEVVETPPDAGSAPSPQTALEAGACVEELNRRVSANPIVFESGRAAIDLTRDPDGDPIEPLVGIMQRCPTARFEVGGHTDSRGDAAANMALSRQRATAVRLTMVARGIPRERLISKGYGEEAPIADNATEAGRVRNRRIEFRLLNAGP